MPLIKVQAPPGFNSQVTQVQSGGRWFDGNLVRWRQGAVEKMPGWQRLIPDPFLHFVRRMHAWLDLGNNRNLLVGSDLGLQLVINSTVHDMEVELALPDPRRASWSLDNLGEDGLALATGGPLQVYHPPAPPTNGENGENGEGGENGNGPPGPELKDEPPINGNGENGEGGNGENGEEIVPVLETVTVAPAKSNGMFVAMPQAQVILWGTETDIEGSEDTVFDPLLIRFSDVGTYDEWEATVSNQAGSYRLSRGSRIMGAIQAPQTTLIFTDTDVWSMSYIGPPLIYGFTIMGTGCGLVAQNAVVSLGRTTYWQGAKGLWQFGDSGVQPVVSTVHDYMFEDLDASNINKCHAAANTIGSEVAFYFPSRKAPFRSTVDDSGDTVLSNEPTRYIKVNTVEQAWDSGVLGRTAWINNNVFGMPLGADLNFRVQEHERGFDDDGQPMRGVFAETGYAEIGDGTIMLMIDQCQPDFKWFGKNGAVNLILLAQGYAGSRQRIFGPFSMTETTQFFNPRARSRYVAIRFEWAERKGFSARVGATKLRAKPTGRRP